MKILLHQDCVVTSTKKQNGGLIVTQRGTIQSIPVIQGVPKKISHSWEPKKLDTSYSETTHLLGLRLWLQGVLMRALCCRSFRSNRCLVSEYEVPNVLGSQKWDIFSETPCTLKKVDSGTPALILLSLIHI